jgi:ABC-type transporter Mla subunit MlaD
VILAINRDVEIPKRSKFLIQAPLTGGPSLVIVPPPAPPRVPGSYGPTPPPSPEPMLEHGVLPIADQPQGQNSATIADLLEQGQGEIRRLDSMLEEVEAREPRMLASLQRTIDNANRLTETADTSMASLTSQAQQIADSLQTTITQASGNLDQMTATLNSTVGRNSRNVDQLLASLNRSATDLNQSMDSLRDLAANKQMKSNLIDTTQNIADLTKTLQQLAGDLRTVSGNPQTQAQLRDSVANIDAASQKANSLLGTLGGTSHVYPVDTQATPYPAGPGASPAPPEVPPAPSYGAQPSGGRAESAKAGLGSIVRNLYGVQIRVSELSAQTTPGSNPALPASRGPQSDFNLILLPLGGTRFLIGANDLGQSTTYNFAAIQHVGRSAHVGGGILYSNLGILGGYDFGRNFGIEGRAYNLQFPTFDAYGNLRLTDWARLFLGERDLTHADRRTALGLQLQF